MQNCEILVNTGFLWKDFNCPSIPPNAVQAGITEDGIKQFIGRAFVEGALTPGRISAESKLLFLPSKEGEAIRGIGFEILVVDDEDRSVVNTAQASRPRNVLTVTTPAPSSKKF